MASFNLLSFTTSTLNPIDLSNSAQLIVSFKSNFDQNSAFYLSHQRDIHTLWLLVERSAHCSGKVKLAT